ncbi:acetylhydrolase [Streptomyces sp. CB01881]|uniref:alpha/beta hydrolase family protein n=1 Tax=Streptomyces sp. CB01881 TaxID=2078691 RepID=UPI000CDCB988|nr:acetylhydrolase [Streptomyces sp. CB01881]AUY52434.1 acetylhydrolase [Streptomyces sp. CB01881]TYC71860.1 acetylhydrolase [Streptomyces sp. CB01881]
MTTTPFTSRSTMTRRRMLGAALAVGAAVPFGVTRPAWAAPAADGPPRLTLPAPTGPYPVGTVSLHLVDASRPDPVAGDGHHRELMADVWYPARDVGRYSPAPWMPAGLLRTFLASAGFGADAVLTPFTAGHEGAPVLRTGGRLPVVVYSHGAHSHRADHTVMVQELASHGYVVVTVGHTYDTFGEFPDGRVVVPLRDPKHALGPADFAADVRFVLDRIEDLHAGRNPDAGRRPLPAGLCGSLDLDRIGVFGWSKGGTAAARVMIEDRRVRAGLSLDGPMLPTITADLDRPFMMMTAEFTRAQEPAVAGFWSHLRGWRLDVRADGALHGSYGDNQALIPQLAKVIGMSDEQLRGWIGTLDPARAVRIQQAYPLAFFDLHLRHRGGRLLDGPSRAFPEVRFLP